MNKIAPFTSVVLGLLLVLAGFVMGAPVDQSYPPSSSPQGSSTVQVQPSDMNPSQTGLEVQTTPADAQVYLNGVFVGDTPLLYTDFLAGTYKITVSKRGYYDTVRWITLDPADYTLLQTDLTPRTGYLYVEAKPSTAEIQIDGSPAAAGIHQLPVGPHVVRITAFGYEEWEGSVEVSENRTVNVRENLTRAPFRITGLSLSRKAVSPLNPGPLGRVVISFHVSTYGAGNLVVTDSQGRRVYEHAFSHFSRRDQSFAWGARSGAGSPLPDGRYVVTVSGSETGSASPSQARTTLRIDRGALIGLRSVSSGTSGLLFAGSPEVLPQSSYSVSAMVLAPFPVAEVPAQVAFRVAPYRRLELDGQASAELTSASSVPFSVSLAAKYAFLRPQGRSGFSAAASLKGTYLSGTTNDTLTNSTGVSLGLPLEYRLGPFGLIGMPELVVSPYPPLTNPTTALSPTLWGYGRAGLFLDLGTVVTGISAALRLQPSSGGIGLASLPLAAGWEIHWLLPNSQLVLTGAVIAESTTGGGLSFMTGVGIGFIN